MCRSFTSSSKTHSWKRVWRDLVYLALLVIIVEFALRIGPIQTLLAEKLDPYENLLWYDHWLPSYRNQLIQNPDYTIWMLGSSPMMTSLNPIIIRENLEHVGYEGITVQNYGFASMLNLETMSQVVGRWLLELDQPKYVVLGISESNFRTSAANRSRIEDSPLENIMLYRDTIDDHIARFLYVNSTLYHYSILARNAMVTPIEQTQRSALPFGGYTDRAEIINCEQYELFIQMDGTVSIDLEGGLDRLDQFIDTIQTHDIPIFVVNIPIAPCLLDDQFQSVDFYRSTFLDPVADHLLRRSIPFFDVDSVFYELELEDQNNFFYDGIHPNADGARMISNLTAGYLGEWLQIAHESNPGPGSR